MYYALLRCLVLSWWKCQKILSWCWGGFEFCGWNCLYDVAVKGLTDDNATFLRFCMWWNWTFRGLQDACKLTKDVMLVDQIWFFCFFVIFGDCQWLAYHVRSRWILGLEWFRSCACWKLSELDGDAYFLSSSIGVTCFDINKVEPSSDEDKEHKLFSLAMTSLWKSLWWWWCLLCF